MFKATFMSAQTSLKPTKKSSSKSSRKKSSTLQSLLFRGELHVLKELNLLKREAETNGNKYRCQLREGGRKFEQTAQSREKDVNDP